MWLTDLSAFASVGENVFVSDKASIYNAANISLGSNVRIDDFCILSAGEGGISIGSHCHISCYVSLIGAGRITMMDFSNASIKSTILSASDDFTGRYLAGPMVKNRKVTIGSVVISKYVLIGAGVTILPGVTLGENACVGAMSLVNCDLEEDGLYAGVPCKRIGKRERAGAI